MKRVTRLAAVLLLAGIAVFVGWRYLSRRRSLPCPAWLSFLLENRFMDAVAGAYTLLDRAGIEPGMRVLDAGCGPGRVTIPAAERVGPRGQVVALDIQPAMLRRLEQRVGQQGVTNILPVLGGLGQGVLDQATFDRAFLVTVLGEIPDQVAALGEIYAALKPGGILSVTEILPDPHFQPQGAVHRLAEQVGLQVDRVYGNPFAYTMNLVKPQ